MGDRAAGWTTISLLISIPFIVLWFNFDEILWSFKHTEGFWLLFSILIFAVASGVFIVLESMYGGGEDW